MTIEMKSNPAPITALGAESAVQAMLVQLDATAAEAHEVDRDATRDRFESMEDAIDDAVKASRRSLIAGVFGGAAQAAAGVAGAIGAASSHPATEAPETSGASTDATLGTGPAATDSVPAAQAPVEESGFSFGRFASTTTDDLIGLGATAASASADRAEQAERRHQLAAERSKDLADESAERANRERSMRDGLVRLLDDVMRTRHDAENRAAASLDPR